MFETARVRVAHRSFGSLTLSIFMHAAVVVAVFAAMLSSTRLPVEPPKEMTPLFVAPALPLAAGTPEPAVVKRRQSQPAPHAAAAAVPTPVFTPQTIPAAVVPAAPAASSNGPASESGVPNGVPGGIPISVVPVPPPAPDAAGPLPVGGSVKAPLVIRRVDPAYPRVALQARISGSVTVECIIDKSGLIRDVRVVRSTFAGFEPPAVDAVRQWLFAPGTLNGRPVDTIFQLTVRFELR